MSNLAPHSARAFDPSKHFFRQDLFFGPPRGPTCSLNGPRHFKTTEPIILFNCHQLITTFYVQLELSRPCWHPGLCHPPSLYLPTYILLSPRLLILMSEKHLKLSSIPWPSPCLGMDSTPFAALGLLWLLTIMFPSKTSWPMAYGKVHLYGPTYKILLLLLPLSLPPLPPSSLLPFDLGLVVLIIFMVYTKNS